MPHLLKRLELNGFKSFAGKTVLEFPPGITAIVGPNGSGKSNIVDAIRWLLGEREAKNLRGAKVDDLIFAGTPKRPRVGLAQASLHFENGKKVFSAEFSEVVVQREVRRDGTNKYFLNKSEILLRDLIDFFTKARLGSRGLVVITQGNSDLFIQAVPTARREMVEEILGLREYQLKKADAERRLKNSAVNLEKVRALVEEILPHLRSLKRQTSRWEKREALAHELRSLENEFFGTQWQDLLRKNADVEKTIEHHKTSLDALQTRMAEAEAREKEVEATGPEEREKLKQIRVQTQEILERRNKLQKEVGRLEAQLELEEKRSHAQTQTSLSLEAAVELVQKIRRKLEENLAKDGENLREAIRDVLKDIDNVLAKPGNTGQGKTMPLQSEFEKIVKDMEILEEELVGLKEKEKFLEEHQEGFYQAFKRAVTEAEAAKDTLEQWESEHQAQVFEKEKVGLRMEELRRQITQAGRRPEEFQHLTIVHDSPGKDFSAMERRMFKLRGDLASIGEVDEALLQEARETEERYEFLSRESEDLEKAKGDLTNLIKDLSEKVRTEFHEALVEINQEFDKFFGVMFGGGHAKLKLVKRIKPVDAVGEEEEKRGEEEKPKPEFVEEEEGGIEIDLRLPKKRVSSLETLSGGERSLVGIAALFALISVSPPPFLVLDEIDAALDDRNARRFADMLKEFSKKTQFVVVTHNRATMEAADVLYGITLSDDGTSKVLSLKLS